MEQPKKEVVRSYVPWSGASPWGSLQAGHGGRRGGVVACNPPRRRAVERAQPPAEEQRDEQVQEEADGAVLRARDRHVHEPRQVVAVVGPLEACEQVADDVHGEGGWH